MDTQPFDIFGSHDALEVHASKTAFSDDGPRVCRCKTLVLGEPETPLKCEVCLDAEQLNFEAAQSEEPALSEAEVQVSALEDQQHIHTHVEPSKVHENSEPNVLVSREPQQESASVTEQKLEDSKPAMPEAKPAVEAQRETQLAEAPLEAHHEAQPEAQPKVPEALEETETAQEKPTNTAVQPGKVSCTALRFSKSGISEKEFHRRLSFVKSKATAKLQEPPSVQQEQDFGEPKVSATPQDALDLAAAESATVAEQDVWDTRASMEEKPEGIPVKANKLLKVNGYQLPPGWGAYISPEEQKVADGSQPKKRGRKPKAVTDQAAPKASARGRKREVGPTEVAEPAEPTKRRRRKAVPLVAEECEEPERPQPEPKRRRKAAAAAAAQETPAEQVETTPPEPAPKNRARKGKKRAAEDVEEPKESSGSKASTGEGSAEKPKEKKERTEAEKKRSRKCVAYQKAKKELIKQGLDPKDPRVLEAGRKATR